MKWSKYRTAIPYTLELAKREPTVQTIITIGLLEHHGTVEILEDVIAKLYGERQLLMDKLHELNVTAEKHLDKHHKEQL